MFKGYHVSCLAVVVLLTSACSARARVATEPAAVSQTTQVDAPTPGQLALLASLNRRGAAPELYNPVWLNSPPLKVADLRGQVVVIDFWTFG